MTRDHDERTSLMMYQMVITIAAGVLVPVLFRLLLLPRLPARDVRPYQILANISGAGFTLTSLIAFLSTCERPECQAENSLPFRKAFWFVAQNKYLRVFMKSRS